MIVNEMATEWISMEKSEIYVANQDNGSQIYVMAKPRPQETTKWTGRSSGLQGVLNPSI